MHKKIYNAGWKILWSSSIEFFKAKQGVANAWRIIGQYFISMVKLSSVLCSPMKNKENNTFLAFLLAAEGMSE